VDSEIARNAARYYFYQEPSGMWRWDAVDRDGRLLGQSGCTFHSRTACVEHAKQHGHGSFHMRRHAPHVGLEADGA
jgi:hypothetical protein